MIALYLNLLFFFIIGWFSWDNTHECEVRFLPEFFDSRSPSKNPRVYKYYRNSIISQFRKNPSAKITFTEIRKTLVGDVGSIRRVFDFLDAWGLINYSPLNKQLKWEDGKDSSSKTAASPAGGGGGDGGTAGDANASNNKDNYKRLCSGCKSLCSIACFFCDKVTFSCSLANALFDIGIDAVFVFMILNSDAMLGLIQCVEHMPVCNVIIGC